jgi:Mg2+ and Co2+ transporter CorA
VTVVQFAPAASGPIEEPGVVASSAYTSGRRVADVSIEEAGAWSKRPGHVVWIGLFEPSDDLLARVQAQFDLHPLAIEDAGNAHQHAKIDEQRFAVLLVARTAQLVDRRIAFGETHLFVGRCRRGLRTPTGCALGECRSAVIRVLGMSCWRPERATLISIRLSLH